MKIIIEKDDHEFGLQPGIYDFAPASMELNHEYHGMPRLGELRARLADTRLTISGYLGSRSDRRPHVEPELEFEDSGVRIGLPVPVLARMFAELDDARQAEFLEEVAEFTKTHWGYASQDMQLCMLGAELGKRPKGADLVERLAAFLGSEAHNKPCDHDFREQWITTEAVHGAIDDMVRATGRRPRYLYVGREAALQLARELNLPGEITEIRDMKFAGLEVVVWDIGGFKVADMGGRDSRGLCIECLSTGGEWHRTGCRHRDIAQEERVIKLLAAGPGEVQNCRSVIDHNREAVVRALGLPDEMLEQPKQMTATEALEKERALDAYLAGVGCNPDELDGGGQHCQSCGGEEVHSDYCAAKVLSGKVLEDTVETAPGVRAGKDLPIAEEALCGPCYTFYHQGFGRPCGRCRSD